MDVCYPRPPCRRGETSPHGMRRPVRSSWSAAPGGIGEDGGEAERGVLSWA